MACISGRYGKSGPIIQNICVVGYQIGVESPPVSHPLDNIFSALIDTGASRTCISDHVVDKTGLKPTGQTKIAGVAGPSTAYAFSFSVGLVLPKESLSGGQVKADVIWIPVRGSGFKKGTAPFDILLGRDIICRGTFTVSFDGHFVFGI